MIKQHPRPTEWECAYCRATVPPQYAHKCLEYDKAMEPTRQSRSELLDELKRRNPEKYGGHRNISFTPGPNWDGSVGQIADAIMAIDEELSNPIINLASRLGGQAFLLEDSSLEGWDLKTNTKVPQTPAQKRFAEIARLLREAEEMLRSLAPIEAFGRDATRLDGEATKAGNSSNPNHIGETNDR